jgi:hypothetical protein
MTDAPQQPPATHAPRRASARARLLAHPRFPHPRRPSLTGGAHPRIVRATRAGVCPPSSALPGASRWLR